MFEQIKNFNTEKNINLDDLKKNTNVGRIHDSNTIKNTNYDIDELDISKSYIVKSGDTLTKIANEHHTTVDELVKLNHIDNPDYIDVGQIINFNQNNVTINSNTPSINNNNSYIVKSGDTLTKIANEHHTTVDELVKLNHIDNPDYIDVGQVIKLNTQNNNNDEVITKEEVQNNKIELPNETLPPTEEKIEVSEITDEEIKNFIHSLTNNNNNIRDIQIETLNPKSKVGRAIIENQEEIRNAKYVTIRDNLLITTSEITINGSKCYSTHVILNDASQLKKGFAHDEYGSGRERVYDFAQTHTDGFVFLNGSHFEKDTGGQDITVRTQTNRIAINHGEVAETEITGMVNDNNRSTALQATAGGDELCIDKNGKVFRAEKGTTVQQLLNMGVTETYACHEAALVENGYIKETTALYDDRFRTVLGMKEPCDYTIFTGYSTGINAANYLLDQGAVFAKSMDQGGSVGLVYRHGNNIDNLYDGYGDGEHRAVGDYIYFTN